MGRSVRCFLLAAAAVAAVSIAVDMMLGWVARCLELTSGRRNKDERLLSMRTRDRCQLGGDEEQGGGRGAQGSDGSPVDSTTRLTF